MKWRSCEEFPSASGHDILFFVDELKENISRLAANIRDLADRL